MGRQLGCFGCLGRQLGCFGCFGCFGRQWGCFGCLKFGQSKLWCLSCQNCPDPRLSPESVHISSFLSPVSSTVDRKYFTFYILVKITNHHLQCSSWCCHVVLGEKLLHNLLSAPTHQLTLLSVTTRGRGDARDQQNRTSPAHFSELGGF